MRAATARTAIPSARPTSAGSALALAARPIAAPTALASAAQASAASLAFASPSSTTAAISAGAARCPARLPMLGQLPWLQ